MDKELIYIFDPFCSWCYAMSHEIEMAYDKYQDQMSFKFITGGMLIGDQVRSIGDKKEYLRGVKENIESMSSVRFGTAVVDLIEEGSYVANSHPPSVAIHAFHSLKPQDTFHFIHDVQHMFYETGLDIKEADNYKDTLSKYGINFDQFKEKIYGQYAQESAARDYQKSRELGVKGFPTIFYKQGDQLGLVSSGFRDFNFLDKIIDILIDKPGDVFEDLK